jgi:hypothetical protein
MRNFWAAAKLGCMTQMSDTTNEDIWASSSAIHKQPGFQANLLAAPGRIGAQQAKRSVLESDKTIMLRADACSRNMNQVRTKYRCWIDERGTFNELALA